MDYEAYRQAFFTSPEPRSKFIFDRIFGFALFIERYDEAVEFYSQVLGTPGYVEGSGTRGWKLGDMWLTLLRTRDGNPKNVELQLTVSDEGEAEGLREAFLKAGAEAEEPVEVLMYEPVKLYPLVDPFGTAITIIVKR